MSVKVRKKGTDEWTFVAGLGRPGPAGPGGGGSGEQGPPGKSAYEIAVENGFEGTEEDWLASLEGEKGDDGATFTPEVSEDGILSWSNDKGLPNPDPVDIKGPPGEGSGGVASFKGRTGAVTPQSGDYTAEMVGAIPAGTVTAIQALTETEYNALTAKSATTLYAIKE